MQLPLTRARLGILAGALDAAGALTLVAASASGSEPIAASRNASSSDEAPGDTSGPCDEAEHANDPECAGVVVTNPGTQPTTPTTSVTAAAGTHSLPTPGGTVTYRSDGTSLTLVSAMPANGWRLEVEQSSGREIELDFRAGSRRVQVGLEIEDGRVRERVRVRDDATGIDVRFEDGAVVADDHGGDRADDGGAGHVVGDDHGGTSGSGSSGSGSSGSSGSGSGSGHSGGSDDGPHVEDD